MDNMGEIVVWSWAVVSTSSLIETIGFIAFQKDVKNVKSNIWLGRGGLFVFCLFVCFSVIYSSWLIKIICLAASVALYFSDYNSYPSSLFLAIYLGWLIFMLPSYMDWIIMCIHVQMLMALIHHQKNTQKYWRPLWVSIDHLAVLVDAWLGVDFVNSGCRTAKHSGSCVPEVAYRLLVIIAWGFVYLYFGTWTWWKTDREFWCRTFGQSWCSAQNPASGNVSFSQIKSELTQTAGRVNRVIWSNQTC